MRQGPRRAHLTVPELTCSSCQELTEEVERKADIIEKLSKMNTELAEELSGTRRSLGSAGKEIQNLERRITRQATQSVKATQVEMVVEYWKKHRPRTRKSSFPPGGKNWAMIEKALSLMAEDEDGSVKACQEAIDGLHLAPYWSYGKRYAKDGPGRELKNRLEHALGDETRIEKCRQITRDARNLSLSAKARAFEVSGQVADAWARVYLDALEERPDDVVEVDGVVTDVG
jgi:hypothetical protein